MSEQNPPPTSYHPGPDPIPAKPRQRLPQGSDRLPAPDTRDLSPTRVKILLSVFLEHPSGLARLNNRMNDTPSPIATPMFTDVIHLPFSIARSTADLYWALLEAVLSEGGHTVVLDRIEPDPIKGWIIHLHCDDPATIDVLRQWEERRCNPDDPLALL